jgi:glycosyltransferase involved in cell wall biosynthesis
MPSSEEHGKPVRTLALVKRWEHHSPSAGYDTLARHLDAKIIRRGNSSTLLSKLARNTIDHGWKSPRHRLDYRYADLQVERSAIWYAAFGGFSITHCLYGDEQLDLLVRYRKLLKSHLVATFHLPWEQSKTYFHYFHDSLVNGLDGAIAVSSGLAAKLEDLFGKERVCYIPHGIDTDTFRPSDQATKPSRLRLLTVGSHKRDFGLIHSLADECRLHKVPADFQFIGPREVWLAFTGCLNVTCHAGLDERALQTAYQRAHALLLPVTNATANNSLLESLACGVPVISTAIGGILDYLDSACGWLLPPGELRTLFSLIKQLAKDPTICDQKKESARHKAETFAWPKVAAKIKQFYAVVTAKSI